EPHVPRGQMEEAFHDQRRPADEEGVDPVEPGCLADGLDAGQPLPGPDEPHEDGESPRDHTPVARSHDPGVLTAPPPGIPRRARARSVRTRAGTPGSPAP